MQDITKISAVLIVRNEETVLEDCLQSLHRFREVVIYLNESTDRSEEIAKSFPNTKVVIGPFLDGFGETRNVAASHASNDWIFHIDADERCSEQLIDSFANFNPNPATPPLFQVHMSFIFMNKVLARDPRKRLYQRKLYDYQGKVHEQLLPIHGEAINEHPFLAGTLNHQQPDFDKMCIKARRYARLYADSGRPRRNIVLAAIITLYKFINVFLIKGRILKGKAGLLYCYLICYEIYLRYRLPR